PRQPAADAAPPAAPRPEYAAARRRVAAAPAASASAAASATHGGLAPSLTSRHVLGKRPARMRATTTAQKTSADPNRRVLDAAPPWGIQGAARPTPNLAPI